MTEAGLQAVARLDFMERLKGNFDAVYALYSTECQEKLGYDAVKESISKGPETFASLAAPASLTDVQVADVKVRDFTGPRGEALILTNNPGINTVAAYWEWAYERGKWRRLC